MSELSAVTGEGSPPSAVPAYSTSSGSMFEGKAEDLLRSGVLQGQRGQVQLILTSPPFPLNRKKKYGNANGDEYLRWLATLAPLFKEYLTDSGSIVIELGNAWESGQPTMSTLPMRAMLAFLDRGHLHLCEQFICFNPARLPSPAQWVNVKRVRAKDSFTYIWWMSAHPNPKADNRKVLQPYSKAMQDLLRRGTYNAGPRPSEHHIGLKSFLKNNGGSIPSNVLIASGTSSSDPYLEYCRRHDLQPHPARMPVEIADFFIRFLTDEGDVVLDPFAGSNTTGASAERLGRRWLAFEPQADYIQSSKGRFNLGAEVDK